MLSTYLHWRKGSAEGLSCGQSQALVHWEGIRALHTFEMSYSRLTWPKSGVWCSQQRWHSPAWMPLYYPTRHGAALEGRASDLPVPSALQMNQIWRALS